MCSCVPGHSMQLPTASYRVTSKDMLNTTKVDVLYICCIVTNKETFTFTSNIELILYCNHVYFYFSFLF